MRTIPIDVVATLQRTGLPVWCNDRGRLGNLACNILAQHPDPLDDASIADAFLRALVALEHEGVEIA